MKQLTLIGFLLCTIIGYGQKNKRPEQFAKTITAEDLRNRLFIVAGPEMEGRETGSQGQKRAAAYIEDQFKQLGLQPGNQNSYQLFYDVYQDSLTDASLNVNGTSFTLGNDFYPSASNLSSTLRFSEVVFAGINSVDSLKNMNLSGKLVMINQPAQGGARGFGRGGIYGTILSKGAFAILVVNPTIASSPAFSRTGNLSINAFRRSIAPQTFTIGENVASAIAGDQFENTKSNTSFIKVLPANILLETKKETKNIQSSDVVGILPGTDLKDQYIVISAHYDHLGKRGNVIYYGADDDGSGTVSIIQIASAFAKAKAAGKGPRRSILFLANSGEEEGLWGSDYFTSHPTIPLNQTTADLNIDMIGRIDPNRKQGDSTNYVYVVGDDKLSSDLHSISEMENNKYTKMELDYKFNDPNDKERIYYRSDHYNFAKNGVPIIFYFDGIHADYHRPSDTPDKINYNLMAKRAQLVFYTAWDMANRDALLKRDIPLDKNIYTR
ncbi:MAG TPA: M28 family peptidase [Flavisolibacter sp.]|nr:M28 family peptidase [Flavisolibacter sp.]